MKKCTNCGAGLKNTSRFCEYCGTEVEHEKTTTNNFNTSFNEYGQKVKNSFNDIKDDGSFMYGIIGFFFPVIGLILYLVWHTSKPNNAKAAGTGALIGVILQTLGFGIPFFSFFVNFFTSFNRFGF